MTGPKRWQSDRKSKRITREGAVGFSEGPSATRGHGARPPKLAFVYDAIFPYVKGGAERRIYEIGRQLASEGHDVHLYGMKYWNGPRVIEQEGMTMHGIVRARPLYTKSGRRKISEAVLFGLASFQLIFARFDAIDCSGFPYFSVFPAKIAALVNRKPLVVTWHEVWGRRYWRSYLGVLGNLGAAVEWLAARMPDVIIAVSDATARDLREQLKVRSTILVIPNGVDLVALRRVPQPRIEYDVVSLGRLLDFKNVGLIVSALVHVQNERELRLLIIGDGPERPKLEAQVEAAGLAERVCFTGFIQGNAVYDRLKSARVLALTSDREGFGMVVLEALACDLPVVTVDTPGNAAKHLVTHGVNGYVAKPDVASVSTMLLRALDLRATLTPTKDLERYDWSSISELALAAYNVQ